MSHPRSLLSLLDFPPLPPPPPPPPPPPMHPHKTGGSNALNASILIIVIILSLVVLVSASIHLLLRFLNRFLTSPSSTSSSSSRPLDHPLFDRHVSSEQQALIDSLPLFSFDSVVTAFQKSAPDCAVCLSRFEPHDQLRLLPACCHAFHSRCIDTWLASNLTCPLCRSTIHVEKSQSSAREESFRLEIGSVSQRRESPGSVSRRSYSMGSFDYVVDDDVEAQIVVGPTGHQRGISDTKDVPLPPGAEVAETVGGRGWLKEYVDRLASSASSSFSSSRALSFRLSGRGSGGGGGDGGATGSSRRSDGVSVTAGCSWDMDRAGEEGGQFFRWLMGA